MWRRHGRAARLGSVRRVRCPTCRREVDWEGNRYRPFCSERCRILDLAAWAEERFRIAGEPVPAEPTQPGDEGSKDDGR